MLTPLTLGIATAVANEAGPYAQSILTNGFRHNSLHVCNAINCGADIADYVQETVGVGLVTRDPKGIPNSTLASKQYCIVLANINKS